MRKVSCGSFSAAIFILGHSSTATPGCALLCGLASTRVQPHECSASGARGLFLFAREWRPVMLSIAPAYLPRNREFQARVMFTSTPFRINTYRDARSADSNELTEELNHLESTLTKTGEGVLLTRNPYNLRRGTIHRARLQPGPSLPRASRRALCRYPRQSNSQSLAGITARNWRKSVSPEQPQEPHPLLRSATAETQSFPPHHQSHSPGKHKAPA